MKLTLDRLCITSRRMCSSCQKKFDQGKAGQIDIEIGNILLNVSKSQRFLSKITISNIIETDKSIYIVAKTDDDVERLKKVGDHLIKQLKNYSAKDYVFLTKTKNAKKLMTELLDPVIPVGTSTVMLPPDGQKELKVQIKSKDKGEVMSSLELSQVTQAILGMYAHYSYV